MRISVGILKASKQDHASIERISKIESHTANLAAQSSDILLDVHLSHID